MFKIYRVLKEYQVILKTKLQDYPMIQIRLIVNFAFSNYHLLCLFFSIWFEWGNLNSRLGN